jgi:ribonuclease HI
MGSLKVGQLNCGKRPVAVDEINNRVSPRIDAITNTAITKPDYDILLIQEPPTGDDGKPRTIKHGRNLYTNKNVGRNINGKKIPIRSMIWIHKDLLTNSRTFLLEDFSDRDTTTIQFSYGDKFDKKIIISSVYSPSEDEDKTTIKHPISPTLQKLITYCTLNKIELIMAGDYNARHTMWNDTKITTRGTNLMEFILINNIIINNKGNCPTFRSKRGHSIIDLTLTTKKTGRLIDNWHVSDINSFADHYLVHFNLAINVPPHTEIRFYKKTYWDKYKKQTKSKLDKFNPIINDINDLDQAAITLTEILRNSFNESTKECKVKIKNKNTWYTKELEIEKTHLDSLYHKWQNSLKYYTIFAENNFNNYKKARNKYRSNCRKAKRKSWRQFTAEIDGAKNIAKMQKYLENGKSPKVEAVRKQDNTFTLSLIETANLMMDTHFINSIPYDKETVDEEELANKHIFDSQLNNHEHDSLINEVITKEKIYWSINSPGPKKAPGTDEIFPALLQRADDSIIDKLELLFKSSLRASYIPRIWRGTKVHFIPKQGKDNYESCKSFRPISLMSFVLKSLEKLIDRHIKDTTLKERPLNKRQHAYQTGKSCISALHEYSTELERAVNYKEVTISIIVDIVGAFDQTQFHIMETKSQERGIHPLLSKWFGRMLRDRIIRPLIGDSEQQYLATRGCPQGATSSPTLWTLVVDDLIGILTEMGIKVTCYADDLVLSLSDKKSRLIHMQNSMNNAMRALEDWCNDTGLSVNPDKSNMIFYGMNQETRESVEIKLYGKKLKHSSEVKFLGVWFDQDLNWNVHIQWTADRCIKALFASRSMIGRFWGITPKNMMYIYESIILPRLSYGSLLWWHRINIIKNLKKLEKIQRLALLMVTGCMKQTPTTALQALLNIPPIDLKIKHIAMADCIRLLHNKTWRKDCDDTGHRAILKQVKKLELGPQDNTAHTWTTNKYHTHGKEANPFNNSTDVDCYTDASVKNARAGIGIYCEKLHLSIGARTTDNTDIHTAELMAIRTVASILNEKALKSRKIKIFTDNLLAIDKLASLSCESITVASTKAELNKLAENNQVHLFWVKSHGDSEGNKKADDLAYEAKDKVNVDIPSLMSVNSWKKLLRDKTFAESLQRWNEEKHKLSLSKFMIKGYEKASKRFLLDLNKLELRTLIGILTGCSCLRKFLHIIKQANNGFCRWCSPFDTWEKPVQECLASHPNLKEENIRHLITECKSLEQLRFKYFGEYLIEEKDLMNLDKNFLIQFAKDSGIYDTYFNDSILT